MRQLVYGCWLIGIAGHIASLSILPDRVAMHFGFNGAPNGWGSLQVHIALMIGLQTSMLLLMASLPWIVRKTPREMVNIPNRDYWLADERREETVARIGEHCLVLSLMLQVFFVALGLCVGVANLSDPVWLPQEIFLTVIAAFLFGVTTWCVQLCRAFRVDEDAGSRPAGE